MAEKYEMQVELKSPPEALWNTIKDINFIYPKLFPDVFDSIEILEGDGRSAGTIRRINMKNDIYGKPYRSKIESLDEENKTVLYRALDGYLLNLYKFHHHYITVKPLEGSGGSLVVWMNIFEKAIEDVPPARDAEDYLIGVSRED